LKKIFLVFFILFFAVTTFLLITYEENLHCTQYSSFSIAVFEMNPHEEEASPLPLVYHKIPGILIRGYAALLILLFLYAPLLSGVLVVIQKIKKKWILIFNVCLFLFFFLNLFIPDRILGERLSWMNKVVFLYGILNYALLGFYLLVSHFRSKHAKG
jgi:hypothetical protein